MKWGIERSKLLTRMSQLPACGSLIHQQYDNFLRLKYNVNWRWVRNPASSRSFRKKPPKLNALQERLVEELHCTGVAICHFDELFQDEGLWRDLSAQVSEFSSSDEVQSVIRKRQQDFEEKQDFRAVEHYIITKYPQDRKPLITASNTLLNFGLNSLMLDVVNSYLGMWSKLIYFDMWYTFLSTTIREFFRSDGIVIPRTAGRFARFFISIRSTGAGAMEYLLGSHVGGPYEQVFPWSDPLEMPYPPKKKWTRDSIKAAHDSSRSPRDAGFLRHRRPAPRRNDQNEATHSRNGGIRNTSLASPQTLRNRRYST